MIENPTQVKLSSDDALTLTYALSLAYAVLLHFPLLTQSEETSGWLEGLKVRLQMAGKGDADMEQEVARLMDKLGYEF